jgi:Repeat of unknown function (DUF346)
MSNPVRWSAIVDNVSSPAAVAWGERRVTVFARGAAGELLVVEGERGEFQPPKSLGVPLARDGSTTMPIDWPIGACATKPGEIQLVARGSEGELVHGTVKGGEWGGFESIGSPAAWFGQLGVPMGIIGAPVACSRTPGTMDVFAVGAGGALLHSAWDGKDFAEFESLGSVANDSGIEYPVLPPISATACGARSIAVAARGARGDLLVKWWDGAKWAPFASLGLPGEPDSVYPAIDVPVPLSSAPVCAGGGTTRLDVFARGPRGDLLHKWWNGKDWTGFESIGAPLSPEGARIPFTNLSLACAWGRFQLDVFARASDGKLYAATCSGGAAPGPATRG